ncbi:hypothetical protein FOMPIDRAFT_112850 [Fomitopsis schrenkii]|nr:hypothetical protein FOMPIDRAFT_112850 [Fomitopsis schrenkii]
MSSLMPTMPLNLNLTILRTSVDLGDQMEYHFSESLDTQEYYTLNPAELAQDVMSMAVQDPTGLLSLDLPDLPDLSESEEDESDEDEPTTGLPTTMEKLAIQPEKEEGELTEEEEPSDDEDNVINQGFTVGEGKDKKLKMPEHTYKNIPAGSTIQPPAGASETVQLGKRKPGKRSHGSSQAYKHRRKERKLAHKKASKPSKIAGLQARVQHLGQTVVVPTFSIIRDVNVTTTGWQGLPPPASSSKDIIKRWKNGSIKEDIGKNFLPLPYLGDDKSSALKILDKNGRLFLYRAFLAPFLQEGVEKFARIHQLLIGPSLEDSKLQKKYRDGDRGSHLPCILGNWRQSSQVVRVLKWHEDNLDIVNKVLEDPFFIDLV